MGGKLKGVWIQIWILDKRSGSESCLGGTEYGQNSLYGVLKELIS